jgi:hypothetical protein
MHGKFEPLMDANRESPIRLRPVGFGGTGGPIWQHCQRQRKHGEPGGGRCDAPSGPAGGRVSASELARTLSSGGPASAAGRLQQSFAFGGRSGGIGRGGEFDEVLPLGEGDAAGGVVVAGAFDDEEAFFSLVGVVEFLAGFGRGDFVMFRDDEGGGAGEIFEGFCGVEAVGHDPPDREPRVVVLCDGDKGIEGGDEEETGDFFGGGGRGKACDSGADGFADKQGAAVDGFDCLDGGGGEGSLRGGAVAVAVAGVFEDVDGEAGRRLAQAVGESRPVEGMARIAME